MSAGISNPGVIDRDEMIDVNLTPVFLVRQAVLPKKREKRGTHHPMQRLTLIYLATYLVIGGCGFLVAPALALRLLLSNGAYGDIMPRVVGLFMFVLGGVIVEFVRARDYRYYLYTIVARSFIVAVMTALYFKASDPLFLVLDAIVLIGLLPSIYVAEQSTRASKRG
jgi:uncharacterized protein YjeT (DUF2065 family)